MPRLKNSVPRYCKHKASGQAVVTLSGQDFYLGPYGTKTSHNAYDQAIAEWLARGRHPLLANEQEQGSITVVELLAAYLTYAKGYYRKNGKPTSEIASILSVAGVLKPLYGREPADTFGPLKLQAVQQAMIRKGWCRGSINKHVGRIVRMFAWGVSQELVKPGITQALRDVPGLHKGRTEAVESAPVLPIGEGDIQATLHHLPAVVADMVRFQRATGCRPDEACMLRPCDVDRTGEVWAYRPESHKTQHHGRERVICIGPRGQAILKPYLLREADAYCFSPTDSEAKRRAEAHANRITPLSYGNSPGTNRSKNPKRPAGERYTSDSYRRAIHRASDLADKAAHHEQPEIAANKRIVPRWSPNRLRHSAATEIRKLFGLEGAQVVLGHSQANVTEIYGERDMAKAAAIMKEVG